MLWESHPSSRTKSRSYKRPSRKRSTWSTSPKANRKLSRPKSTKRNTNLELLKTTSLLKPITRLPSTTKIQNLTIKSNKQKSNSTSPSYKPEDSKRISTSPETNSFPQRRLSMWPKNKMTCSWTQSLKSQDKYSTGKNSTIKTKMKSKPLTDKETIYKNNFSSSKPNSNSTMKNSIKEKRKLSTMNKKSAKETSLLRASTNKFLKFKKKSKATVKKQLWPTPNIYKHLKK